MSLPLAFLGRGLERPECVLAHRSGLLFTADWHGDGGVAIVRPDGGVAKIEARGLPEPLRPNGIALDPGGRFVAAHLGPDRGGVFRLDANGRVEPLVTEIDGRPIPSTNFVMLDATGRLWITVSTRHVPRHAAARADVADGFVAVLDPGGAPRIVIEGLGYTNECLLSPDGRHLYVNETFARRTTRFELREDGTPRSREVVAQFGPGTFPDGLAADVEGGLWITSIVSNRVIRLRPDGSSDVVLEDADAEALAETESIYRRGALDTQTLNRRLGRRLANISSLAFGGPDLRTAYLGCLHGDAIASFAAPVAGRPPLHWAADLAPLVEAGLIDEATARGDGPAPVTSRRRELMAQSTLKVVTIGAGYFARFHHEAWSRVSRATLAAICDIDRDKAEAAAREVGVRAVYDDPEEMLARERPDLVDIATPPSTHRDLVALAASHGIDVVCQKAFTRSLDEARETVAAAEAAGITLVVHENFRFQPWFREIRRLLDDGAFGELFSISFRLRPGDGQGARAYLDRQPYFQSMERFLIHETGIHFIDTFRFLCGDCEAVYSELRRLNPVIAGEDAGVILMTHEGGVRSLFDGNRLSDHVAENRRLTMGELLVEGSAGSLRLDGYGHLFRRDFGSNEERAHEYSWENRGFAGDSVFALQNHVVAHLLDGAAVQNDGRAYLENLEVEDAVYESAAKGQRIPL